MFFKLNKKLSKASLSADNSLKRIVGPTVHNVLSSNRLFILRLFSALLYYVIGVSYYCSEEKWDILDAIFFITVSVSTVGYGDLHPTTDNSRLFTAFFILFGLVFVLTAVDDFARHVAIKFQNNVIDQYFSLDSRAV
jgi:voltage-gated potassium channel